VIRIWSKDLARESNLSKCRMHQDKMLNVTMENAVRDREW